MHELNETQTRAITDDAVLGIAGYEGQVVEGEFSGRHAGVFETAEDARRWLAGDEAVKRVRIYGKDPK